jgi:hypothetical protein
MRSSSVVVPAVLFVVSLVACGAGEHASVSAKAASDGQMSYAAAPPAPDAQPMEDKAAKKDEATTWKRSQIVPNATRLMVGEREELPLKAMQAKVTIDGFRARVVLDYVYANDRDRQLEGSFQLRLPEEASPYFFAFGESTYEEKQPLFFAVSEVKKMGDGPLEIINDRQAAWTHPKEAKMVPREKAAFAYAETVRQRVDPALVEWAGAGVFNARVFPLAAHKLHRIVVGYDLDLVRIGDDLEYRIDLPEKAPASVVDVDVQRAPGTAVKPAAQPVTDGGRARYHWDKPQDRTITVRLKSPGAPLIVGTDAKTGDFFASQARPSLPQGAAAKGSDSAVFLLDTSLSSNPDRFNIWLKMMRAVLDKNRDALKRFDVLFFGVDAYWYKPGFVDNTPQNVDALMTFANGLALEGATDVGVALAEAARPKWLEGKASKYDLFLLSDGAATWGESSLHAMARTLGAGNAGSLFAYQTGLAGTDVAALTHLARESGGAVFSVTGEAEIDRAATAHRARPWQLVSASVAARATCSSRAGRARSSPVRACSRSGAARSRRARSSRSSSSKATSA